YAAYLPGITRRADLNTLLNRMLGHVSVSHLVVDGGDVPPPAGQPSRGGLLGADFEIAEGKYRFRHILRTSTLEDPLGLVPAPLDRPDARVADGSFVLAIDGKPVEISKPIDLYLEGKANRPIQLTVASDASGRNSQTLMIYPIANEATLRAANQVKAFQQRVEEASQGQLGYVYVANYGAATMDAIRGLLGNSQRKGVIIDQRYNGGGITPDFLIEWLQRKPLYFYTFREGDDIATPVNPGPQVKVLMTNELNGSAAETFAFMFKLAKLGPIVGKRTFGGGIGPYFPTPDLLDGGFVQLPNRAAYQSDGTSWGIENIGVSPTIEVDILPADVLAGRDPQLEKAIEAALAELKKIKTPAVRKPKYPVHPK
ncbi:MAG TPA: S41 family peptidase, partial [Acidobacteriota bacterium]|nr:S41 family peptidase [Acidobacteriota bacterium]